MWMIVCPFGRRIDRPNSHGGKQPPRCFCSGSDLCLPFSLSLSLSPHSSSTLQLDHSLVNASMSNSGNGIAVSANANRRAPNTVPMNEQGTPQEHLQLRTNGIEDARYGAGLSAGRPTTSHSRKARRVHSVGEANLPVSTSSPGSPGSRRAPLPNTFVGPSSNGSAENTSFTMASDEYDLCACGVNISTGKCTQCYVLHI